MPYRRWAREVIEARRAGAWSVFQHYIDIFTYICVYIHIHYNISLVYRKRASPTIGEGGDWGSPRRRLKRVPALYRYIYIHIYIHMCAYTYTYNISLVYRKRASPTIGEGGDWGSPRRRLKRVPALYRYIYIHIYIHMCAYTYTYNTSLVYRKRASPTIGEGGDWGSPRRRLKRVPAFHLFSTRRRDGSRIVPIRPRTYTKINRSHTYTTTENNTPNTHTHTTRTTLQTNKRNPPTNT